jgi:hypothetical protein
LVSLFTGGCVTSRQNTAPKLHGPSRETVLDIYTALLRERLAAKPWPRKRTLHVYMNDGAIPELANRFPGRSMRIHSFSPGPSPPHARYYFFGSLACNQDVAELDVSGIEVDGDIFELRKTAGKWHVVRQHPFVVYAGPFL